MPATASSAKRARKPVPTGRGQRVLAALVSGAGLEEIATREKLSRRRVEKIMRDELRRRWVAPAEDFAKLQIARLDAMIVKLIGPAQKGDLPTIDRVLRILDRMDRYHGFTRATRAPEPYGEEERERLLAKLNAAAARLQLGKPEA